MKYTLKISPSSNKAIFLHANTLSNLAINECNMNLTIGANKQIVKVDVHDDEESVIILSEDVFNHFSIPTNLDYELTVNQNELIIGPVIGLLVRGKTSEMTMERIRIYKNYMYGYKQINGLILLFTSDGIDEEKRIITGFAYDPIQNVWEKGTFPFPAAVFIRKTLKTSMRNQLERLIGSNYFNSHVFNKWEMWEWFSSNDSLKGFFAETVLANDFPALEKLVNNHSSIYIKPASGMQGSGIYLLSKTEEGYTLKYRFKNENISTLFDDWYSIQEYLQTELKIERYIAQQGISLIKENGRLMDLRVIVTKDHNGKWSVPGIVTKLGEENSIVSNISSGGSAEQVWETLQRIYQDSPKDAFRKYIELENLAIQCCKYLENKGLHLAYIGIDIGMDEHKNLWVIEINNRSPDMTIALDAKDEQLYYKIKTAPLKYAKWLSGFRSVV
ncbi:YheC/YheD family protein [Metabacillus litoralis]|uniref:YheC/YheD family endospore coat-associated protein n=1 Tax=Metabacillus litoralis TaxID=152268 RepID=UPI001CFD82E4|nr:YheC/YheD family protein [Metabacillus litoralis]